MPSSPHAKIQESFFRFPPTPPNSLDKDVDDKTIELALHVLATQRDALTNLHDIYLMDQTAQRSFDQAVNVIRKSRSQGGRAIVSGMGKSGKIGEKFVATLNSFAIQSTSLHPTEAMHGDLGMIGQVWALPNRITVSEC